jgi:glutamine amidotransferase
MIALIDYGMGNIGSIFNMLRKIGAEVKITWESEVIHRASKLILPGVGAFDNGMKKLSDLGLIPVLEQEVLHRGKPIIGICLGMQLFSNSSEEGSLPGLGWIDADTVKFRFDESMKNLKVPHMGWNTVAAKKESSLLPPGESELRFYFVHSYHLVCHDESDVLTTTHHGIEFASSIRRDNIIGVQFHPEKSHRFGLDFFTRFVELPSPC